MLKWALEKDEGPDVKQALALQAAFVAGEVDLRVPTLWRYEVANILGLKKPDLAEEWLKVLLDYEIEEVPLVRGYGVAVLKLMQEIKGVTFYDCSYHALAIRNHGVYVTADRDYVKKAKRKGHISLLSEWSIA